MSKYRTNRLNLILLFTFLLATCTPAAAQLHRRDNRMLLEGGGGINLSYFDVGGGAPAPSFQGGAYFDLDPNWRLGASVGFHRTRGSDAGTQNDRRDYAYNSNLKEISLRGFYTLRAPVRAKRQWTRRFEPRVYAGIGVLQVQDIQNRKLSTRAEGGKAPDVAPVFSGGFGLAYGLRRDLFLVVEGGTNISTSDYLEGFDSGQHSSSPDIFHSLMIKLSYRVESFE